MDEERERRNVLARAAGVLRELADQEYIAARFSYKLGFEVIFFWHSQQALEKYLKAILIFNHLSTRGLRHNLVKAYHKMISSLDYDFDLPDGIENFLEHICIQGNNRYRDESVLMNGEELLDLDQTVWKLRRYCMPINYEVKMPSGKMINMKDVWPKNIKHDFYRKNPHKWRHIGGYLEEAVKGRFGKEVRDALVWKNFYYGDRKKHFVKNLTTMLHYKKSVHGRDPEIVRLLNKALYIPKPPDCSK